MISLKFIVAAGIAALGLFENTILRCESSSPDCQDQLIQVVADSRPGVVKIEAKSPLEEKLGPLGSIISRQSGSQNDKNKWYVSIASGIIWTHDGYIVTTTSVIKNATQFRVVTHDGSEFTAQLIGKDEESNLAVLKIDSSDHQLTVIPRINSPMLEGTRIVLVGYGFGGTPSVADGLAGEPPAEFEPGRYTFQFTAAIRPGNSGSALIDYRGQLAGVVLGRDDETGLPAVLKLLTQKDQPDSKHDVRNSNQCNCGIAIPVNIAERIVQSLIEHGSVIRGWIGISVQLRETSESSQLQVVRILSDSPAQKSGFQMSDTIQKIDGRPIRTPAELGQVISAKLPGSIVSVELIRDGKSMTLPVEILQRPSPTKFSIASNSAIFPEMLGFTIQNMTVNLREYFEVPNDTGILVYDVKPESNAAKAGIQAGDIILKSNDVPISSVAQFNQTLSTQSIGSTIILTIKRKSTIESVELTLK